MASDAEGERHMKERVGPCLVALSQNQLTEIIPIYVLGPGQVNFPIGEAGNQWLETYEPAVEERLREQLSKASFPGLSGLQDPQILMEPRTTVAQAVTSLLEHAKQIEADSIVVSTGARSGVSRMLLGSFAESLLSASHIPVWVIGPNAVSRPRFSTIIFPTNFGERSKRVFRRIVKEAYVLRAKVVLFHAMPQPVEPLLESGAAMLGGTWVPVQTFFSDDLDRHRSRTEAWARWARHQGVEVETEVDTFGGSISESILLVAGRHGADLIAMETHTGAIASVLVGSITKQVLRLSNLPVLVIRTYTEHLKVNDKSSHEAA
jgi:nucleotide-binding universal stress UspA family protein